MADLQVIELQVPEDLYSKVQNISHSFKTDFNTDMIHLMECYVNSFQQLHSDAAAAVLLGVK